jgi:hypothetical protein
MTDNKNIQSDDITTRTYKLTTIKQLIDLNLDFTNFELNWTVTSKNPECEFLALVVDQTTLDNNNTLNYKKVKHVISGHIVSDKNIYQNYFLLLKTLDSNEDCEVNVTIDIKKIPPRIQKIIPNNSSIQKTSNQEGISKWKIILGIVIILGIGYIGYTYYYKSNDNYEKYDKYDNINTPIRIFKNSDNKILNKKEYELNSRTNIDNKKREMKENKYDTDKIRFGNTKSNINSISDIKTNTKSNINSISDTKTNTKSNINSISDIKTNSKPIINSISDIKTNTKPIINSISDIKTNTKPIINTNINTNINSNIDSKLNFNKMLNKNEIKSNKIEDDIFSKITNIPI